MNDKTAQIRLDQDSSIGQLVGYKLGSLVAFESPEVNRRSARPFLANVRDASPQELAQTRFDFHDQRLPELLFRYRARNWPEALSAEEAQRWEQFRRHRLQDADGGGSITLAEYHERIALLRGEREGDAVAQWILDAMDEWATILNTSNI